MAKRQTIAIDIDDVLSFSAEGFVNFSNERWGMNLKTEHYTEAYAVLWNVPIEEALRRIEEVVSSGVHGRYQHMQEASPVLSALAARFRLVAVTSRRTVLKPETDEWIARHFPSVFETVEYAGIWDGKHHVKQALQQTKAELCRKLGADYLIDDQIKHCMGAVKVGVQALLFGDYSWNQAPAAQLPKGVVRVKDWLSVGRYFHV